MLHTTNPTKRIKILQKECMLRMYGNTAFTAVFSDFNSEKKLPTDAEVFIEAHRGNTYEKIDCGTVENISAPENYVLTTVDTEPGPPIFVIYVSNEKGKILASAHLMLEDETKKSPMIPIKKYPLGDELWKIDYQMGPGGQPYLLVNDGLDFVQKGLNNNPVHQALILPHAFREILMHYLLSGDAIDNEEEWKRIWLDVAKENNPGVELPAADAEREDVQDYIDETVRNFANKHHFNRNVADALERENKRKEKGYD